MHDQYNKPSGDRGVAYVRVSDEIQDTKRQHTSIQEWAVRNGLVITQTFEDPGGRRHKAETRKGFQGLLKAVQAGLVDWIVVDHQDRLGFKGPFEWYHFLYLFQKHRVELWQSTDNKLLSSEDVASVVTTGIGAHGSKDEMTKKASRDLGKKREMAKAGEWPGGYVPYGCDVRCRSPQGHEKWRVIIDGHWKRLQVYPDGRTERYDGKDNFPRDRQLGDKLMLVPSSRKERLDVVRQMYEWYDTESLSLNSIAKRLNKLGIRPVSTSGQWYAVLVKGILANPVYLGRPGYNKNAHGLYAEYDPNVGISTSPPRHEEDSGKAKTGRKRDRKDWILPDAPVFDPIVAPEVWERVQAKLTTPKRARASRSDDLWLSGLLFCGKCKKPMVGWSTPKDRWKLSYACSTYRRYGIDNDAGCRLHRTSHDHMVDVIKDYLKQTTATLEILRTIGTGEFEGRALDESLGDARSYWEVLKSIEATVIDALADSYVPENGVYIVGEWGVEVVEGRARRVFLEDDDGCPDDPDWIVNVYDFIIEDRKTIRAEKLKSAEGEFQAHYQVFLKSTSAIAKELANSEMTRLDGVIQALRSDEDPLSDQLARIGEQWLRVIGQVEDARRADKGQEGRRYGETIRRVIERIICTFDYKNCGQQLRSTLSGVEIVPLTNIPSQTFRIEGSLVRG